MLPTSDLIVGSTVLVGCSAFILLYAVCLRAILASKELMKNSCYIFIVQLGVADITTLALLGIGGCMTLAQSSGPGVFNWMLGAVMELSWSAAVGFVHILAFNRFMVTSANQYTQVLFGKKGTVIFSALPWLMGGVFFTLAVITRGYVYDLWSYSWYYDYTRPQTVLFVTFMALDKWNTIVQTGIVVLWYILMLVAQRALRNQVSGTAAAQSAAASERIATLTAGMICLALAIAVVIFNLPPYMSWAGKYLYLILTWVTIFNAGINPIVYLCLNITIRKNVRKIVSGKALNAVSVGPTGSHRGQTSNRFRNTTTHM